MTTFPRHAQEFTTTWLTDVLAAGGHLGGHKIAAIDARDSDIPGQTAEVAIINVTWADEACPLPQRFIAKYTSRNADLVATVINAYQQYWRETSFYTEFPVAGLSVPRCFHSAFDADNQAFVILMEDLAPAESPSWAATPAQITQAIEALPAFHARWWNAPLLREKPWLVQFDDRPFFAAAAGAAAAAIPMIRDLFGDAADHTVAMLDAWPGRLDRSIEWLSQRPYSLVHGDFHPKQMFFPTPAGGRFAVIDWQFSFVAQGAWDFARVMSIGMDTSARREREAALVAGYHTGLLNHGVTGYDRSALDDDIRMGLLVSQMIMAIALADTDIKIIEAECKQLGIDWQDVIMLRGEAAVRDWHAKDLIESI